MANLGVPYISALTTVSTGVNKGKEINSLYCTSVYVER